MSYPNVSFSPSTPGTHPVLGAQEGEKAQETASTQTGISSPVSTKPQTLDNRTLLVMGRALASKEEVADFAKSFKPSLFARVKEFLGFESATAKVLRAANRVDDQLKNLERAAIDPSQPEYARSADDNSQLAMNVVAEAKTLASALNQWLEKHDHPGAKPQVREQARDFREQLTSVTKMINDMADGKSESEIKDSLFGNALPKGFPLSDAPRLKELMISHAIGQAVHGAKSPESFLRAKEIAAVNSTMSNEISAHFSEAFASGRATNQQQAMIELQGNPELLGLPTSKLLQDSTVKANLATEYKAVMTSILGDTLQDVKQTARSLPPEVMDITRQMKQGLDQAVKDGKITQEEADRATRLLVVNNTFLRGICPEFLKGNDESDPALGKHLMNRFSALSAIVQKHANDLPFGGTKDPHLASYNTDLAMEKTKINTFIDEVMAQL
ncbi:MAG: hypothetical protein JNN01_13630 [Opitutaceae bacterium]|nr:hypothetical protein [Opitutaceae bacterium]